MTQEENLIALLIAVVGLKHFGNPIPKEWYAAAKELYGITWELEAADLIINLRHKLDTEQIALATIKEDYNEVCKSLSQLQETFEDYKTQKVAACIEVNVLKAKLAHKQVAFDAALMTVNALGSEVEKLNAIRAIQTNQLSKADEIIKEVPAIVDENIELRAAIDSMQDTLDMALKINANLRKK